MPTLLDLSNELILIIIENLTSEKTLSSLTQCSKRLSYLLHRPLLKHNILHSNSSSLLWAVKHGNTSMAAELLDIGANLEVVDYTNHLSHQPEIFNTIDRTASVEQIMQACQHIVADRKHSDDRRTPLSWAAELNHVEIVQMLVVKGGADVNSRDEKGWTPLTYAACKGHVRIIEILLDKGADPNLSKGHWEWQSSLEAAVRNGRIAAVRRLIACERTNLELGRDSTPFAWAATKGFTTIMKLMLDTGKVNPDLKEGLLGRTALAMGALERHVEVVKLLLAIPEVDANSSDRRMRRPLFHAVEYCFEEEFEIREVESEKEDDDADEQGPRIMRGEETVVEICKMLVERGADPSMKDRAGCTPLTLAAKWGYVDVVRYFLSTGKCDLDGKDDEGRTPLMWAQKVKNEEMIKVITDFMSFHDRDE